MLVVQEMYSRHQRGKVEDVTDIMDQKMGENYGYYNIVCMSFNTSNIMQTHPPHYLDNIQSGTHTDTTQTNRMIRYEIHYSSINCIIYVNV
jgi:hypothetical protein